MLKLFSIGRITQYRVQGTPIGWLEGAARPTDRPRLRPGDGVGCVDQQAKVVGLEYGMLTLWDNLVFEILLSVNFAIHGGSRAGLEVHWWSGEPTMVY